MKVGRLGRSSLPFVRIRAVQQIFTGFFKISLSRLANQPISPQIV